MNKDFKLAAAAWKDTQFVSVRWQRGLKHRWELIALTDGNRDTKSYRLREFESPLYGLAGIKPGPQLFNYYG